MMNSEETGAVERPPFRAIVEEHYAGIAREALFLAGDRWLAEDLTQEVFAAAQAGYGRFRSNARPHGAISAWLRRILRNLHIKSLRRRRVHERWIRRAGRAAGAPGPATGGGAPVAGDPLEGLVAEETSRAVWKALRRLPERYREVIYLRYVEGLQQGAIASLLGMPVGTVKSRIASGLDRMRRTLGAELNAPRRRSGDRALAERGLKEKEP